MGKFFPLINCRLGGCVLFGVEGFGCMDRAGSAPAITSHAAFLLNPPPSRVYRVRMLTIWLAEAFIPIIFP